jgi:hypothetical protein
VIFDPFGGSGTTALAAAGAGCESFFAEVNPYLAWVAETKVNHARAAVGDPALQEVSRLAGRLRAGEEFAPRSDHALLQVDRRRHFFPPAVAERAVGLLNWIDQALAGPSCELARLACATALVPCSNMVRRTDLRRRRSSDPLPTDFATTVAARLEMVVEDVTSAGPSVRAGTTKVAGDVRQLDDFGHPIALIVTSPPYLNGTNYFRNTKLELLALGFIRAEQELDTLRTQSITAGINNVSSRRAAPDRISCVETVATKIDEVAYDPRIPTLVRGYFSDMRTALARLRQQSVLGARFYLDIGDSRFAGIHVPTHELLIEIAGSVGWRLVSVEPLRERKSYDGAGLTQVLIELETA